MKITPLALAPQLPLDGITSGIFPYLGGSVSVDQLRSVVMAYESAIVPGRQGAKLAAKAPGVLIDPAVYAPQARTEPETLFDYDDWLMRQKAAGVPLILTDSPRILNKDQSALRKALARWDAIDEPTLVVLPIEPWWLREGLPGLIEEVRAAGRPVAVVLLHRYNGLDISGSGNGPPEVHIRRQAPACGPAAQRHLRCRCGCSSSVRRFRRLVGE